MAYDRLTLDVDGTLVEFTDPGKARAAARRWNRMAAELDTPDASPDVTLKVHELRARAKAAQDWARRAEDTRSRTSPTDAPQPSAAPSSGASRPAGDRRRPTSSGTPRDGARRQAATALAQSGVRKARRSASGARRGARKAARRYEAAGGAPVATGAGALAVFFFGSILALVLVEDFLSARGAAGFAGATNTVSGLLHRLIAPVPIVTKGGS